MSEVSKGRHFISRYTEIGDTGMYTGLYYKINDVSKFKNWVRDYWEKEEGNKFCYARLLDEAYDTLCFEIEVDSENEPYHLRKKPYALYAHPNNRDYGLDLVFEAENMEALAERFKELLKACDDMKWNSKDNSRIFDRALDDLQRSYETLRLLRTICKAKGGDC